MHHKVAPLAVQLLLGMAFIHAAAAPLPVGRSEHEFIVDSQSLQVYAYKPAAYAGGPLLVSFHGLSRRVDGYMNAAQPLADRLGLLIVMPLFDRSRFPYWRYQALGITRTSRRVTEGAIPVEPAEQWTSALIAGVIERVRLAEGRPGLPYYLLGHSAGGQIANRFAAFVPNKALRIVVANPSSWVMPTTAARFPYGYGDLPPAMSGEDQLKRYLASPLTVFLGTEDLLDKDLDMRPPAMLQGRTRYERGLAAYRNAERTAKNRGWPFNWKLVIVEGVGHDSTGMYGSPLALKALRPD